VNQKPILDSPYRPGMAGTISTSPADSSDNRRYWQLRPPTGKKRKKEMECTYEILRNKSSWDFVHHNVDADDRVEGRPVEYPYLGP